MLAEIDLSGMRNISPYLVWWMEQWKQAKINPYIHLTVKIRGVISKSREFISIVCKIVHSINFQEINLTQKLKKKGKIYQFRPKSIYLKPKDGNLLLLKFGLNELAT